MALAAWYLGVCGVLGQSLGAGLALGFHAAAGPRQGYLSPGVCCAVPFRAVYPAGAYCAPDGEPEVKAQGYLRAMRLHALFG